MFRTISLTLADGTEQGFNFLAVGSTPYRYKQVFKSDLMKDLTRLLNKTMDYVGEDADFSVADKLAFIMNCQAEKRDLNVQNYETFIEWVDQFEASSLYDHFTDFIGIYLGNKEGTSSPKKEVEP